MTVPQVNMLDTSLVDARRGAGDMLTTASGVSVNVPSANSTATQSTIYYASTQAFVLTANGLKPSTQHKFNFDNVDVSANCQPYGGLLGSPLTTDSSGNLVFTFYYTSGLPASTTDVTSTQSLINKLAGTKLGIIQNTDGTSSAAVQINFISQAPAVTFTTPTDYTPSVPVDLGINIPDGGSVGVTSGLAQILGGFISLDFTGINVGIS
jgi:hypothetical protein